MIVGFWSNVSKSKIFVDYNANLEIGNNTRIIGAHISVSSKVKIGNNVQIAPNSVIIDNDFHTVMIISPIREILLQLQ